MSHHRHHISRDPSDGLYNLCHGNMNGGLRYDAARSVTGQNLDRYAGIVLTVIRQIDERSGYPVGELVRVHWVNFFKHFLSFPCPKQSFHEVVLRGDLAVIRGAVVLHDLEDLVPQPHGLIHIVDADINER